MRFDKASSLVLCLLGFLVAAVTAADSAADGSESFNGGTKPVEFNMDTFSKSVKKGYWLVDHYSPMCGHCKKLAPMWEKFVADKTSKEVPDENSWAEANHFHFGNINCIANGDLCEEHDVVRWPTIFLYRDGEKVDQYVYDGSASTSAKLAEFVERVVEESPYVPSDDQEPEMSTQTDSLSTTQSTDSASTETPLTGSAETTSIANTGTRITDTHAAKEAYLDQDHFAAKAQHVDRIGLEDDVKQALEASEVLSGGESSPDDDRPTSGGVTQMGGHDSMDYALGEVPNPHGISVPLDSLKFSSHVTSSDRLWFIKFYTPWCGHCDRMAPSWVELARAMQAKLNIGEVNCEEEKALCKDIRLRGFPSLLLFKGHEHVSYDGLRGLGDMLAFANMAIDSGVHNVDVAEFEAYQKKHEVIFLYLYDGATSPEDFEAIERVSLPLIGHAPLLKTNSTILAIKYRATTFPRLIAVRDGKPSYYSALGPAEMRDYQKIFGWMKSVWLPVLPELGAVNSHEIMQGRTVVLAFLDRSDPQFEQQKQILKDTALEHTDRVAQAEQADRQKKRDKKQEQIDKAEVKGDKRLVDQAKGIRVVVEEKQPVGFAWVDAVFWAKWLKNTYGVDVKEQGPRVIINEEDKKRYWGRAANGNPLVPDKDMILDTISLVTAVPPKLSPVSTVNHLETVWYRAIDLLERHPFMIAAVVLSAIISIALTVRNRMRRSDMVGSPSSRVRFNIPFSTSERKDYRIPFFRGSESGKSD